MKNKTQTVIEITDAHVKFLQAEPAGRNLVVSSCEIRPVRQTDDDGLTKLLKEIASLKAVSSGSVILVLPRRYAILRVMRLPSHNETEINDIIGLQLVNRIPYPVEDVVYEFTVLDKTDPHYARVLVTAVHKEVIDRYLGYLKEAGLNPSKLTLSSQGLSEWLAFQQARNKQEAEDPTALINIDAEHTEICFCHAKQLLFSRSIHHGTADLKSDVDGIKKQVDLSLQAYTKENIGPPIRKLILLSSVKEVAVLRDRLAEAHGLPVEILTSFENVLCRQGIDLTSLKDQAGLSLSVCAGILLGEGRRLTNLIAQEGQKAKASMRRRVRWGQFVFLLVLCISLLILVTTMDLNRKAKILERWITYNEQLKFQAEEVTQKTAYVEKFREEFEEPVFLPDALYELNRLTPPEISYSALSLDGRRRFILQGYALTGADVNNFQSKLVASAFFQNVLLQYATKRNMFNAEVVDFKMTTHIGDQGPPHEHQNSQ